MATKPQRFTREEILARKVGHGDITIDGRTIGIRALTIDEAIAVRELNGKPGQAQLIIELGMTDPKLTRDEIDQWAANDSAGMINAVSEGIAAVSGMSEGSGKDAYKSAG